MINYESIKSLYNDKPTLLQWLKKVEAALNDATLVDVVVDNVAPRHIELVFTFDDGTTLRTSDIELPQDYSVAGAAIVGGHLILTLTNGNTIDAGNLGAVTSFSIDANQHLIVAYQDGTTQDLGAIFSGNVNISGDLSVTGNITADGDISTDGGASLEEVFNVLSGAADENNYYANEGDITLTNLPTGLNSAYAHWRVSNNKLNIIITFYVLSSTSVAAFDGQIATFTLPAWVLNKLYAIDGQAEGILDTKLLKLVSYYLPNDTNDILLRTEKYSGNIRLSANLPSTISSAGFTKTARLELNFVL